MKHKAKNVERSGAQGRERREGRIPTCGCCNTGLTRGPPCSACDQGSESISRVVRTTLACFVPKRPGGCAALARQLQSLGAPHRGEPGRERYRGGGGRYTDNSARDEMRRPAGSSRPRVTLPWRSRKGGTWSRKSDLYPADRSGDEPPPGGETGRRRYSSGPAQPKSLSKLRVREAEDLESEDLSEAENDSEPEGTAVLDGRMDGRSGKKLCGEIKGKLDLRPERLGGGRKGVNVLERYTVEELYSDLLPVAPGAACSSCMRVDPLAIGGRSPSSLLPPPSTTRSRVVASMVLNRARRTSRVTPFCPFVLLEGLEFKSWGALYYMYS